MSKSDSAHIKHISTLSSLRSDIDTFRGNVHGFSMQAKSEADRILSDALATLARIRQKKDEIERRLHQAQNELDSCLYRQRESREKDNGYVSCDRESAEVTRLKADLAAITQIYGRASALTDRVKMNTMNLGSAVGNFLGVCTSACSGAQSALASHIQAAREYQAVKVPVTRDIRVEPSALTGGGGCETTTGTEK